MNPNINPEGLPNPFTHFCMSIGAIPTSYKETLDYYETLLWLIKYLENTVIPAVDNNAEALTELQGLFVQLKNYVEHYFDNLDVQEEINNKLDEMIEDGTLQEIIADYLNSKAVFGFDNVESMKAATNLIDGSYAKTLGYYEVNDDGGANYKIRTITDEDIVDESFIIALSDNTLIAELIIENDTINVKQVGCKCDGVTDDTEILNNCANKTTNIIFTGVINLSDWVDFATDTNIIGPATIKNYGLRLNTINFSIKDITFLDTFKSGIYGSHSNISVENCIFNNCCLDTENHTAHGGIVGTTGFKLNVINSKFIGLHGMGAIYTINNGKIYCVNNTFDSCDYRAFNIIVNGYSDPTVVSLCDGLISNNYIKDCGKNNNESTGAVGCNGIYCPGGKNLIIDKNNIINSRENAVEGRFTILSNNLIDGTNVEIETKATPSVEGVFITGTGEDRICKIFGNTFKNIKRRAISSQKTDSDNIVDLSIYDNYFDEVETYDNESLSIWINGVPTTKNKRIYNNKVKSNIRLLRGDKTTFYKGDIKKLEITTLQIGVVEDENNKEVVNQLFEDTSNLGGFTYSNLTPSIVSLTDSSLKALHFAYQQYNSFKSPVIKFKNGTTILKIDAYLKGVCQIRLFEGNTYKSTLFETQEYSDYTKISSLYKGYDLDVNKEYYIVINCPTADKDLNIVNINYEIIN